MGSLLGRDDNSFYEGIPMANRPTADRPVCRPLCYIAFMNQQAGQQAFVGDESKNLKKLR